jgi:hypothetical protein
MSEGLMEQRGSAIPEFYVEAVHLTKKSEEEGRPCYEDRERVRIFIPGDKSSSPAKPVDDDDKKRWPEEYRAFKEGREAPLEGTPLIEWPPILKSQVMELAHFHIRTVEHLAAVNDAQLQNLGMGSRALREQAKTYLAVARDGTSHLAKMVATIEDQAAQINVQKSTIEDMGARLAALEKRTAA